MKNLDIIIQYKHTYLFFFLIILLSNKSNGQYSYNRNFVSTTEIKVPNYQNTYSITTIPAKSKVINVEYIDGLGRSQQKVAVNAMVEGVDMVAPTKYDDLGRVVKQYLPYSIAGASTGGSGSYKSLWESEQLTFYQNNNSGALPNDLADSNPFSISNYEPSPLNRVVKAFSPGNAWAGTTQTINEIAVKTEYRIYNTQTDLVKTWEFNNISQSTIPVLSSTYTYQTGDLTKSIIIDEHGKSIHEYKDKVGNTILKKIQIANSPGGFDPHIGWLCTYYIYDNLNQLRFVLPPKATEWLRNNNWILTQSVIDELCFWYEYDTRGRLITKHVPGAKPVDMVYDSRDRLVLTQDANMKNDQKWMLTIYDLLNRPLATGFWTSSLARSVIQANVDAEYWATNETVTILGDPFDISMRPTFIPISGIDILTVNYYDKYRNFASPSNMFVFDPNYTLPYTPGTITPAGDYVDELIVNAFNTNGLLIASKTKILDPNLSTANFLGTIHYYDEKFRKIQTNTATYIPIAGQSPGTSRNSLTTQYTFTGKVVGTFLSSGPNVVNLITKYELDIAGNITNIYKGVDNGGYPAPTPTANKLVVTRQYDALGRLKTKVTGYGTICENKQDFTYNIRGWIRGVNMNYLNGNILPSNQRFFGYELGYNIFSPTISSTGASISNPQLNGNIGSMLWASGGKTGRDAQGIWQSSSSGIMRKYDYTYDNTNRLKKADFKEYKYSNWINSEKDFSVTGNDNGIGYDENGNILSMNQKGVNGTSVVDIDILNYTYNNSGISNKLLKVKDNSPTNNLTTTLGDFIDGTNGINNDYMYDDNGNLTNDANKDINAAGGSNGIVYNHLNLPLSIKIGTKGQINYIYDALGNKLMKTVFDNATSTTKTTTYLGPITYTEGDIKEIAFEEGRIRFAYTAQPNREFKYDWFVKDHLGNVRMVLTEEPAPSPLRYGATFEDLPTEKITAEQIKKERELYGEEVLSPVRSNLPEELKDKDQGNRKAALLKPGATKVPYKIVKATSGDRFSIAVQYYYRQQSSSNTGKTVREDIANNVLKSILTMGNGVGRGGAHGGAITIQEMEVSTGVSPQALGNFSENEEDENNKSNRPRAYLNYMLLDTAMRFVKGGAIRVGETSNENPEWKNIAEQDIEATKNGYFLTYLSNEEQAVDDKNAGNVYFDNFVLITNEGPVLEENHYYPFGLLLSPISSNGVGKLSNNYKYNGIEFSDELDINVYTAFYRNLDPQIGRWWQVDPKSEDFFNFTPYNSNFNNPISNFDPLGDCPPCAWALARAIGQQLVTRFIIGAAISGGMNVTIQTFMHGDLEKGIQHVDWISVASDGAINTMTGGVGFFRTLFSKSSTVNVIKGTSIVTIKLLSATTSLDFSDKGNLKIKSVFNNDKSLFEVATSLILDFAGDYSAEQIKSLTKAWAKSDKLPSNFAPKTKEEKELINKLDKLVKSEGFEATVDNSNSFMSNFIDAVVASKFNFEVQKIGVKSSIIPSATSDNLRTKSSNGNGGGF